jgi:hypothetical protein
VFGESAKISSKIFEQAEKSEQTLQFVEEILRNPQQPHLFQEYLSHAPDVKQRYQMLETLFQKTELSTLYKTTLGTARSK